MSNDNDFERAKRIIDEFAPKLMTLNSGKKIPTPWKNYLLKSLQPIPQKRGRKHDFEINKKITKSVVLRSDEIFEGGSAKPKEPSGNRKSSSAKKLIADELNVPKKKVQRVIDRLEDLPKLIDRWKRLGLRLPIEEKKLLDSLLEGISDAIRSESEEGLKKEKNERLRNAEFRRKRGIS